MPHKPVTLKDIYESVECLRHEIQANYVTKDRFESEIRPIKLDITDIQGNLNRGVWIVLGAVFIAILAAIGLKG
jgi:hypothetical protein